MVRLKPTGIRKINFKDYAHEPLANPEDGALWEALNPNNWSIQLANGSLPTSWKGQGYRHCLTATQGYDPKYTITPPVGAWWHTQQQQSGRRYQHCYDFMFRVDSSFPGTGSNEGVVFGYFVQHGGSPTFVESAGYRLRFDGATIYLEKFSGGAWTTFQDASLNWSQWSQVINADQEYYVRLSYWPNDVTTFQGRTISIAGTHVISITDDFDMRGQGNVFQESFVDPSPVTGGSTTKLMMGGYNTIVVEFDCITYSNGFMQKPSSLHYFSSIQGSGWGVLKAEWPQPSDDDWDYLDNTDVIECWFKSRCITIDGSLNPTADYWKTICKFDGRVIKIAHKDTKDRVQIMAVDENIYINGDFLEERDFVTGGGLTYYDWLQNNYLEHDQSTGRITWDPGVLGAIYATVISANWNFYGKGLKLWELLNNINNGWSWWNPSGFMIAQFAAIATGKTIRTDQMSGEVQFLMKIVKHACIRDSYSNTVNQYHNSGGGITVTQSQNAVDVGLYGEAHQDEIDVKMPAVEGAQASQNHLNQQNDLNPIVDVFTRGWGLDFYPGCKIGIVDPSKDLNETDYTMTEEEIWWSDDPNSEMRGAYRMRFAYHDDSESSNGLPRVEYGRREQARESEREQAYHDHHFLP